MVLSNTGIKVPADSHRTASPQGAHYFDSVPCQGGRRKTQCRSQRSCNSLVVLRTRKHTRQRQCCACSRVAVSVRNLVSQVQRTPAMCTADVSINQRVMRYNDLRHVPIRMTVESVSLLPTVAELQCEHVKLTFSLCPLKVVTILS